MNVHLLIRKPNLLQIEPPEAPEKVTRPEITAKLAALWKEHFRLQGLRLIQAEDYWIVEYGLEMQGRFVWLFRRD